MLEIQIRRPHPRDQKELYSLFAQVVSDTFRKEGITDNISDPLEEIETKKKYLRYDLESNGKLRYFLIAEHQGEIIGTIEFGQSSDLISRCTDGKLQNLVEVGTAFVKPEYQNRGVGSALLQAIYAAMKNEGIHAFCLDSGYATAQKIWTKKFGPPEYFCADHWGKGMHHMIWRIDLSSVFPQ